MHAKDLAAELPSRLGLDQRPDARHELASFVRHLVHDVNGALATLTLELYGVSAVADDLRQAVGSGDLVAVLGAADELKEIHKSLEESALSAGSLLEAVRSEALAWTGDDKL